MWCLEMRSTADWNDCRYRQYTRSRTRAEQFQNIPRIQFTDSGHGVVPCVVQVSDRSRGPIIRNLDDYVSRYIISQKPGGLA